MFWIRPTPICCARGVKEFDRSKPLLLSLVLQKKTANGEPYYDVYALTEYLQTLGEYPFFKGTALLEKSGRMKAFFPKESFLSYASYSSIQQLVQHVNDGNIDEILKLPGACRDCVAADATIMSALIKLEALKASTLPVSDDGKLKGVVEKDDLVARVVIALAGEDKANDPREKKRPRNASPQS